MTQVAIPTLPLSIDWEVIQDWGEIKADYDNEVIVTKESGDSVIIAFNLAGDPDITELAKPFGSYAEEDLHLTLVYLGSVATINKDAVVAQLATFASVFAPVDGQFNGVARFVASDQDEQPVVLTLDSVGLAKFREILRELFPWAKQNHGFVPHVTLAHVNAAVANNNPVILPEPLYRQFDTVWLYWGEQRLGFPLVGDTVLKHLPGQVEKQLPIGEESINNLLSIRQNLFNLEIEDLAGSMYGGKVTLGQWEEDMKRLIREFHSSYTAVRKGGWDNMTHADWGKLGNPLKAQYKYLHNFAKTIADKRDTISLEAIQARAKMYGNAAGYSANVVMVGDAITKHLPWLPRDGSTECFFWLDKVRVYTMEEGYIRLGSVKVGQHVLTHEGRFRAVLSNWSKRVYSINSVEIIFSNGCKVCVTPDHLFMDGNGSWVRADILKVGDLLTRIGKKCKSDSCNNYGEYVLVGDVEVVEVRRVIRDGTIGCLVVDEDESFAVTNGIISHNCLVNCKCRWELLVVDTVGEWKVVQAVWRLSPAEHCDDCLGRNGHTLVFNVHKTVSVPRVIGYTP